MIIPPGNVFTVAYFLCLNLADVKLIFNRSAVVFEAIIEKYMIEYLYRSSKVHLTEPKMVG